MLDIKLTHLTTNNRFIKFSSEIFRNKAGRSREEKYFGYLSKDLEIL